MSKQVRNILMILAIVCLVSIVFNIIQATSGSSLPATANVDSTMVKQLDSLKNVVKEKQNEINKLNDIIKNSQNLKTNK